MRTKMSVFPSLIFLFLSLDAIGQQQAVQTQYLFNQMIINPAYTGNQGHSRISVIAKNQWADIEGAPKTQVFTYDGPINKLKSASLGFLFINDKVGVSSQTGGFFSYSYTIKTSEQNKLSFGLQTGFNNFSFRESLLKNVDLSDPLLSGDYNVTKWNFGIGLFYETERFFAGISIPRYLQNKLDINNANTEIKALRHYYGNLGFLFDLSRSLKLQPSLLVSYIQGTTLKADVNMNLLINELIWAGFSFRSFDALDFVLKLKLTSKIWFGYIYDVANINMRLKRVNGGTHEFMLAVSLSNFVPPKNR